MTDIDILCLCVCNTTTTTIMMLIIVAMQNESAQARRMFQKMGRRRNGKTLRIGSRGLSKWAPALRRVLKESFDIHGASGKQNNNTCIWIFNYFAPRLLAGCLGNCETLCIVSRRLSNWAPERRRVLKDSFDIHGASGKQNNNTYKYISNFLAPHMLAGCLGNCGISVWAGFL
jgi:hypothetical protein